MVIWVNYVGIVGLFDDKKAGQKREIEQSEI